MQFPAVSRSFFITTTAVIAWALINTFAFAERPTLDACDQLVRDAPGDPESYLCYLTSVRAHGRADDAVRRLDAILMIDPQRHRARMILAMIEEMRGQPRAEALYRQSADDLAAVGDLAGEVYARRGLAYYLGERGKLDEADAQLERAMSAAREFDSPLLVAWVITDQASQAGRRSDHGMARRLYREAERLAFPKSRVALQGYILSGLGNQSWYMGDLTSSMDYFRREVELRRSVGDAWGQAIALSNIALLSIGLEDRGRLTPGEVETILNEALEAAVQSGNRPTEGRVRALLGQRLTGQAALDEFRRAELLARQFGDLQAAVFARRLIAKELFDLGPEHRDEAFRILDEAIAEARSSGQLFDVARGRILRAEFAWEAWSREDAVSAFDDAFDAVEAVRERQPEQEIRARVFSQWTYPYYRLSGRLLGGLESSTDADGDLELAFETLERMRARTLLEYLDAAGAATADPESSPLRDRMTELRDRMTELQRELLDPEQGPGRRRELLDELDGLQTRGEDLRDRIAREDPTFAALHLARVPRLGEVRRALASDQAVLAFQVADDPTGAESTESPEGGSWLLAITRDDVRAFPLPPSMLLIDQIHVFLGLIGRRDGSEAEASLRLHRDLLDDALSHLPPTVGRLVIVPDGVLHRLPFSTLRASVDAPPLAARFELAYAPSVGSWLRWQESDRPASRRSAIALVDPALSFPETSDESRPASGTWTAGLRLGPLRHSRREAEALFRSFEIGAMRSGPAASEQFLKQAPLGSFALVHLATHAVVDPQRPGLSAVLLAPGSPDQDGLLQTHEIVELPLDGQIVVLSACRSVSGEIVAGEGVLGFARAFFQAGSRAVIGSLWPIRDEAAAALMEEFSRQLGAGRSLSAAMAEARRVRIAGGAPAADWAGMIVLGDGDLIPLPAEQEEQTGLLALLVGATVLVLLLAIWIRRRQGYAGEVELTS